MKERKVVIADVFETESRVLAEEINRETGYTARVSVSKLPGRHGMTYTQEGRVDVGATSHRRPDE
jgi:hypothetical protein